MGGRARTRLGFAVLLLGLSALCLVASQAYTTRAASASGPATFGKTTVGASSGTFLANRKRVNRFELPEAGSPIKLSIYPASTKTSGQQVLKGIIYSDASGQPQKTARRIPTTDLPQQQRRWFVRPEVRCAGQAHCGQPQQRAWPVLSDSRTTN
jgi:hypothetical protein